MNLSHIFAGQSVGVIQVSERIWLVTFIQYDLGYLTMRRAGWTVGNSLPAIARW